MKSLIAVFVLMLASSAQAALSCVGDLPSNNMNGLPVSWWILIDSNYEKAIVSYSGGPSGGVYAEEFIANSIPVGDFNDGFSIEKFGFMYDDRETHLGLGFKTENYREYTTGELIINVHNKPRGRGNPGMTELDRATLYCRTIN